MEIPTYDKYTQKLVTSVDADGNTTYMIENYPIEEMNDGSEWYQNFFSKVVTIRLKLVNEQVIPYLSNADPNVVAAVNQYVQTLKSISEFPVGFRLPDPPDVGINIGDFLFIQPRKISERGNYTMKVSIL